MNKLGFTLIEVLITLVIIGVVAAITLPSVINKYTEMAMLAKLKKNYSILQTAFQQAILEHGNVNTWSDGASYNEHTIAINNVIKNYLKTVKYCEKGDISCYKCGNKTCANYGDKEKSYGVFPFYGNNMPTMILSDGTIVAIKASSGDGYLSYWCQKSPKDKGFNYYFHECGFINIDLNGTKGPNTVGYDFFSFVIYQDRIVPLGRKEHHSIQNFNKCLKTTTGVYGYCTAWALDIGNMDYKRCRDELSWDGKHSCKE